MIAMDFLYRIYERRLSREIKGIDVPRHIGIILDGNRRWARALGTPVAHGHRRGADHISEVLGWAEEAGVSIVTLWMLSTDNLQRSPKELDELLNIIVGAVGQLAVNSSWQIRVLGDLDLLPSESANALRAAAEHTKNHSGMIVNVAIGYGGRQEITQAVQDYLHEQAASGATLSDVANSISVDAITDHIYTKGQPDPDLIIRTSGEQRMSGFMLWQTVHTELYFCETYWPDFRRIDFLRALRDYSLRERRKGK
ncbi:isoprenyl transferase [Arcanobacterium pinnipediorum]|uniref:Isoprenyl transferase n=1 Tax=Arcanobacterium pinnipediorum TaxID=1503041 RepID=A0ABY5AKF5_9ACTO|nr:isoprenyl transferase [Arcanobacterium pinnipediorum]USR80261.1 isoprenyl transferase [Arcanobacterium pinnipediorum]